jgi:hypothetical protein
MAFEGERLARRFGVPVDDCNLLLEGIMYQMLERGETANDFEACVEQLIKENPLGCPHVFIQNIQNPAFAHLNGTFAVRGPCSPRVAGPDRYVVTAYDDQTALPVLKPTEMCLKLDNLRIAGREELERWVDEVLEDTSLCQHRRISRLQFVSKHACDWIDHVDIRRRLVRRVVDLARAEAEPDFDFAHSCAIEALFHFLKTPVGVLDGESFLRAGGLDAMVLFLNRLNTMWTPKSTVGLRCACQGCSKEQNVTGRYGVYDAVGLLFAGLMDALPDNSMEAAQGRRARGGKKKNDPFNSAVPFHITLTDEGGLVMTDSFHTFVVGLDGHKSLAAPETQAAMREIINSKDDTTSLIWKVEKFDMGASGESAVRKYQNSKAGKADKKARNKVAKAAATKKVKLDEMMAKFKAVVNNPARNNQADRLGMMKKAMEENPDLQATFDALCRDTFDPAILTGSDADNAAKLQDHYQTLHADAEGVKPARNVGQKMMGVTCLALSLKMTLERIQCFCDDPVNDRMGYYALGNTKKPTKFVAQEGAGEKRDDLAEFIRQMTPGALAEIERNADGFGTNLLNVTLNERGKKKV